MTTPSDPPPDLSPSVTARFVVRAAGRAPKPAHPTATLTGWVQEGVEHGCVVLVDGTGAVLANLVGLPEGSPAFGTEVRVSGEFVTGMVSLCQQGRPLRVTAIAPR